MDSSSIPRDETLIKLSLERLTSYTERGRELAWRSIRLLDEVAQQAAAEIRSNIEWLESNSMDNAEIRAYLTSQLDTISRDFSELPYEISEKLDALPGETFTVSLFGRTKVGKSTLVSILTKGDGSIIGNGSQRTTREARSFFWEGLNVIDVPGVSATGEGGACDVKAALEAARLSDLIIFIVLSDSLQKETAGYLAQVRALGKPVICLANIKAGRRIREGHEEEDIGTLCRYIDYEFADGDSLRGVRDAVLAYDDEFSQKWGPMPFAYAHLLSAFFAQQERYAPWKEQLSKASRFSDAICQIADEIGRKGCFMRLRSYIDTASKPLVEAYEGLSLQGIDSLSQLRLLNRRILQYERWVSEFESSCEQRARTLATDICDELKADADRFAERHFNDRHASEHWVGIVGNARSEARANKLLAEFEAEATERLRSFGRTISLDLSIQRIKQERSNVTPRVFIDKKRIWDRAMTATEVILGGAFCFTHAPVVATAGAVAGGVHFVGDLMLKDGKRKREDAIREFRRHLGENITSHGNWLRSKMMEVVRTEIVGAQLEIFGRALRSLYGGIASLATAQLSLSAQLCDQINDLSLSLVQEALDYEGQGRYTSNIIRAARIPGDMVLLVTKHRTTLPTSALDAVFKLLGDVIVVEADENEKVTLSSLVADFQGGGVLVEYSGDSHVIAYAPDTHGDLLRRIRVSMQLNNMLVIK